MTFNYSKFTDIIEKKIDYYGGYVNYIQNIDGTLNTYTNVDTYNNISIPLKAIVKPYSNELIDAINIKKTDRQVFIKSTLGRPNIGDNLEINEQYFKVIEVKDIAPGVDDTLVYVLQVRSYEAATPVDTLTVKLSTLDTGEIVKDPYALDESPEWVIIAQNHHNNNITTLLCYYVWEFYSFDGTFEGGGYYPDTPWKQSYMRHRLNNLWPGLYFSADLTGILQTVQLETQTDLWNDKVSLLSREELFNVEEGSSSGSYISYFADDTSRIGRWYSDQTAMEWWTRDVYSWSAPDGVIRTVDADGTATVHNGNQRAGVRPMIFLSGDTNVVLNPDGKYSIDY